MPYVPGDNWCICDLTGRKVLMSDTRKTWDGLRVWKDVWYPRHPQLDLRAIPDRMAVVDGRPRPADIMQQLQYGYGSFCLLSIPGNVPWTFWMDEDGALRSANVLYGVGSNYLTLGSWRLYVDDDGAMHLDKVNDLAIVRNWKMRSPGEVWYDLVLDITETPPAVVVTASDYYA